MNAREFLGVISLGLGIYMVVAPEVFVMLIMLVFK